MKNLVNNNIKPNSKNWTANPLQPAKNTFECDKCGDKFTKSWILKHHIANAHPLKCNVCDRKFTQKLILDHHMALCKSENTFECDVCDSKFTQKGDLEEHIANVHEGKKSAKYPKIKLKGTGNLESHTTELKFGVHEEKKPTERDLEDHNVHEEKKSMSPKIEFEVICDYVAPQPNHDDVDDKKEAQNEKSNSSLANHEKLSSNHITITSSDDYECDMCNKLFQSLTE